MAESRCSSSESEYYSLSEDEEVISSNKRKTYDNVESCSKRAKIDQNFRYTIQRRKIWAKDKHGNCVRKGKRYVTIVLKHERCNGGEFIVSINNDIESLVDISDVLKSLDLTFQNILSEILPGFSASSLVQVCISSASLSHPVSTKVLTADVFSSKHILNTIENTIRITYNPIPFYRSFQISVKVLDYQQPDSSGPKIKESISSKCQNIISICDEDNISMARALVVALAKTRKDPKFKYVCDKRKPLQKKLAKELHQNARVPEGFCSIEEAKVFADHLGIKINILDTELEQKIISVGQENESEVHLWRIPYYAKYHYNVITSIDPILQK